jgi:hypothetical protein
VLDQLRRHGRHIVVDWPTTDPLDNAAAIQFFWNRGQTLCVLEQDVAPTPEQLLALERCSEGEICNQATHVGGASRLGYDFRIRRADGTLRWGNDSDEWADLWPLGCTVFRPTAMRRIPLIPATPWNELDTVLAHALGGRAHVHLPAAAHNH